VIEQEPGSGGKEIAEATIRNLRGYTVYADRVTGSKEVRAEPFAAQVQGGNVFLVADDWVRAFLEEAEAFPNGKLKDQIDAAAGAFAWLTQKPPFNWEAMTT
jgi:predicted phage terminase large subunit-like protein